MTPGAVWNACVSEAGHPEMAFGFTNRAGVPGSCWFLHVEPTEERCAVALRAFDLSRKVCDPTTFAEFWPGEDETIKRSWRRSWANGRLHLGACDRAEFGGEAA